VYLKTSLTGDESADVQNYHREHADFPHQTAADRFTESQFESYRRLEQHVVEKLFEELSATEEMNCKKSNAEIFEAVLKGKNGMGKENKPTDCC
jgi:hypothetical protein